MGEFSAGRWMIGLLLYFFMEFLIIYSVLNASAVLGLDTAGISANDPGFSSLANAPFAETGRCGGDPLLFCNDMPIYNETLCNSGLFPGCFWDNGTFIFGASCIGAFEGSCSSYVNQTYCITAGCDWLDSTTGTISNLASESKLTQALTFMLGFNAEFGTPAAYRFIFAFFFTYLPFIMLLLAIYFSIPIIH